MSFIKPKDLDQMLKDAEENWGQEMPTTEWDKSVLAESIKRARETLRLAHLGLALEAGKDVSGAPVVKGDLLVMIPATTWAIVGELLKVCREYHAELEDEGTTDLGGDIETLIVKYDEHEAEQTRRGNR